MRGTSFLGRHQQKEWISTVVRTQERKSKLPNMRRLTRKSWIILLVLIVLGVVSAGIWELESAGKIRVTGPSESLITSGQYGQVVPWQAELRISGSARIRISSIALISLPGYPLPTLSTDVAIELSRTAPRIFVNSVAKTLPLTAQRGVFKNLTPQAWTEATNGMVRAIGRSFNVSAERPAWILFGAVITSSKEVFATEGIRITYTSGYGTHSTDLYSGVALCAYAQSSKEDPAAKWCSDNLPYARNALLALAGAQVGSNNFGSVRIGLPPKFRTHFYVT
jgi:hypothetical protein